MSPIPMILYCPNCGLQHVDAPEPHQEGCQTLVQKVGDQLCTCGVWRNRPHRSHKCAECEHIWRPADVPTTGVILITTAGAGDSHVLLRGGEKYASALRDIALSPPECPKNALKQIAMKALNWSVVAGAS